MKPVFSPAVIGELRRRVIEHNGALEKAAPDAAEQLVKLAGLKSLYARYYNGTDPHQHALQFIDIRLGKLKKQALEKAEERDNRGRWRAGAKVEVYAGRGRDKPPPPPAPPSGGDGNDDNNALLDAAQTQVIPETRYSVFGPPIAGAAGVGIGALSGATASFEGDPVGRAITRGAGKIGGKLGGLVGATTTYAPIQGARFLHRTAGAKINAYLGRPHIPMSPVAGKGVVEAAQRVGSKIGGYVGRGASHTWNFVGSGPAAGAKWATRAALGTRYSPRVTRVGTGIAGAAIGALLPGIAYGSAMYRVQSKVGPYEDAAFPRRVRKIAGPLLEAPEVLAKQAELLDDLHKLDYAAAGRAAMAAARRVIGVIRPSVASHSVGPLATGPSSQAAHEAFQAAGNFGVGPNHVARAGTLVAHIGGFAAAGAGAGAIAGAAGRHIYDYFVPEEHPRDEHGRFKRKSAREQAKQGAKIGAALGIGAGAILGALAARRGHGALLQSALERLGTAVPAMHTAAETTARDAHAKAYADAHKDLVPAFAPGSSPITAQTVGTSIRKHASVLFGQGEGAVILGGPKAWYRHNLDAALDKEAKRQFRALGGGLPESKVLGVKGIPKKVSFNLIDNLDETKLTEGQKKIWDDLLKRRNDALAQIDQVYKDRSGFTTQVVDDTRALEAEAIRLKRDSTAVPDRLAEFEHDDTSLSAIRQFAKDRMGHELKAKTRKAAIEELAPVLDDWENHTNTRLNDIADELKQSDDAIAAARRRETQDLTDSERMAVANPFARSENEQYFPSLPDYNVRNAEVQQDAVRPFEQASNLAASETAAHLNSLIVHHQGLLEAGIPKAGFLGSAFQRHAPVLSGHLHQAVQDTAILMEANRSAAKGMMRKFYDFVHLNRDPVQAGETMKTIGRWAADKGKQIGAFGLAHYGKISTGVGLATTLGVIDMSTPKRPLRVKPKDWKTPRDIRVLNEPLGPGRPGERLVGLTHRDRETNQQTVLWATHIAPKKGDADKGEATPIAFGENLDQVRNHFRNRGNQQQGGGGGNRPAPIEVKNRADVDKIRNELLQQKHITSVGPGGDANFRERQGGNTQGHDQEVVNSFSTKYVTPLDDQKPQLYWDAMKALFEAHLTDLLNRRQRAQLIVGSNNRKGIFGTTQGVFGDPAQNPDKGRIVGQLKREINQHHPSDADQVKQMRRATWVVAQHYNLSEAQLADVHATLDKAYTNATSQQPQQAPRARGTSDLGPAGSPARLRALVEEVTDGFPEDMRPPSIKTDQQVHDLIEGAYSGAVANVRRSADANALSQDQVHDRAVTQVYRVLEQHGLRKAEPEGGLRKYLSWEPPHASQIGGDPGTEGPRPPKLPGVPKPPGVPPISGAATGNFQQPPAISGAAKAPGQSLATRTNASQHLGNAGSYGLGEAGYQLANAASQFIPGGGWASTALRGIAPLAGSFAAGQAGIKAGNKLGAKLGDTGDNEPPRSAWQNVGGLGGALVAQGATHNLTDKLGQSLVNRAAATGPGQAISGAAERFGQTGIGQKIGGAINSAVETSKLPGLGSKIAGTGVGQAVSGAAKTVGSKIAGAAGKLTGGFFQREGAQLGGAVGTLGGDVAGTAVEPGGGTLAGGLAGKAIGAAVGAGAGYLADEGVGYLYRALSGYGPHVADMAAQNLGVPAGQRAKHAAAFAPQQQVNAA